MEPVVCYLTKNEIIAMIIGSSVNIHGLTYMNYELAYWVGGHVDELRWNRSNLEKFSAQALIKIYDTEIKPKLFK